MITKIIFYFSFIGLFLFSTVGFSTSTDSLKIIAKKNKKFLKDFSAYVYIPAGKISTRNLLADQDFPYVRESNDFPELEESTINSLFMYNREVTNINYLEFLSYYKERDTAKLKTLLPDTLVWQTPQAFNAPYVEYYLRHPSYQNYPVVGVSHYQAELYCEWLTARYNQNPDRVFKKVNYRLPTEAEWIYASNGGNQTAIYPWAGQYMRKANGDMMANCLNFGTEGVYRDTVYKKTVNGEFKEIYIYRAGPHNYMGVAGSLHDAADITAPAKSYWPNAFGLYNMAGNVCEMVAEVGITHGGSWKDPGHYLQNQVRQFYSGEHSSSAKRGFRFVMEVVEY